MKYLIGPVAAIALFFSIPMASAEEMTGTIAQVDAAQGVIILDSGEQFRLAEGVSTDGLAPGTEVTVSYQEQDNGEKVVDQIQPAQ